MLSHDIPDLLHPVPMSRLNMEALAQALSFAFAAGGSDVQLYEQLGQASIALSTWDTECFARDLFLETFLQKHRLIRCSGASFEAHMEHLVRVLSHPPADMRVTLFRQHILHELRSVSGWQEQFRDVYEKLQRIRSLLSDAGLGYRLDPNRRRIDILDAVRAAFLQMAESFSGAESGLLRLHAFGQRVVQTEGFRRLQSLLSLDENAAAIEARMRVGHEGQLRQFEIVRIVEPRENPFYLGRAGKLLRKLSLFFRGYRFSDAEVLNCLVDDVFTGVSAELGKIFQLLGDMELYLVALNFERASREQGLQVCLPRLSPMNDGVPQARELRALFNPLLCDTRRPVPIACNLSYGRHSDTTILTGPNSGGKTRLLQALSLCQLLAQGGFFVPAAEASLVWADGMFLSIGEHPDAEQSEGRLGMELLRIRRIFESMRVGAFVVVDELCSGTNPAEGEAIFRMVLQLLPCLSPQAFISTHFLELAARLQAELGGQSGINFLQVELGPRNQPTFQFVPGVARASLAGETAARLGVTHEELMTLVDRKRQTTKHQGENRVRA